MKDLIKCAVCLLIFMHCAFAETNINNSPVGYWKTIDDVTGQPKSIVELWENPKHQLFGKVVKIYSKTGVAQIDLCSACQGERHNQPIIGMVILENLHQDKKNLARWTDGQIIDPKNGKNYQCLVQVFEQGQKLNIKGYIGLPLFGRSQTWLRVNQLA